MKEQLWFIRKAFSFKRIWNTALSYLSYFYSLLTKNATIKGCPPVLMIEPTNICNLRCPLCPSGTGSLKRKKGYLPFELYTKIIDEIYDRTMMLILWNQGEPFLHEGLLDMIRYASDRKLFTITSTNANIMPDAKEIVKSGLDTLIISLDGATQETYNKYRLNGDIEKVVANVKDLVEAKKKLGSSTPIIKWQVIVMKHNEHEINDIQKLARELGVDTVSLKSAQIYSKEDIYNFLPENPKFRRYRVSGDDFELKFGLKNRCVRLWTQPVINCDGEMAICCFDKDGEYKIGNLENNSFRSLWHSSQFDKMRKTVLNNRASISICRNCGEGVKLMIKEIGAKNK